MADATHPYRRARVDDLGRPGAYPVRHRNASPPNNLPLELSSFVGSEHTYGPPQEDARCLHSVVENSSEIMKDVDLDGALLSGAWRSR